MAMTVDCPQFESWSGLLGDTLSPDERAHYERHLESCPLCQDRLDDCYECDEAWRQLANHLGDPTETPADPTLAQVLDRVRSTAPSIYDPVFSPRSERETEPADLYFLRPSDRPELLGTLGPYEVREVIGQGGMGVVLKAYEPALHRLVAIKVLAAAVAGSATARRRFTREAQAAAAVCHDHIVPVHGVHETDGLPYLVMQYVAGESLQGRLDREGPLEVTETVRIALQTASGLAAAHAQGLIHRDIKPANLLLENGLARVKITDFGLARMADDAPLTQPGVVAGTPEYMAPEQARGEPVDHRADLFSLGSVIYAMCTGRPPFRAASAVAVLRQVSDDEPAPIRSINPTTPVWLEQLIAFLMAKDPCNRFESAAEVAALLEGYLAHLRQPTTKPAPELRPLLLVDPLPVVDDDTTPLAAVPLRSRPRWPAIIGLAAIVGVGALWLGDIIRPAAGAKPMSGASIDIVQDFRGSQLPSDPWRIFGPDADAVVRPEAAGLRVTLPVGRMPGDPVGVVMESRIGGDFDITVGYELTDVERPTKGWGCGLEFFIMTDSPMAEALVLTRGKRVLQGDGYYCSRNTFVDGKRKYMTKDVPGAATAGRLRMTRTGAEATLWAAEGTGEFQELARFNLGPEDVKMVRLGAHPGVGQNAVDLRITDVKIHPSAVAVGAAATSSRSRPWSAVAGVLFLVFAAGAFRYWWVARARRLRTGEPGAGAPNQGVAFISRPATEISHRLMWVILLPIGLVIGAFVLWFVALRSGSVDAEAAADKVAAPVASPPQPVPFDVWSTTTSKDGRIIVAGGGMWEAPGEIGVWDATTYKPLQRFSEEQGVASVAVSADGKTVVSGSWSGHVRLRDLAHGKIIADFEVPGVSRVAFSPDGTLLATVTEAKTVQIWDVARRELLTDLDGDKFKYHCVTFSPDGKRLLVGGGDWKKGGVAQVNVWDIATKQQIQKLTGHHDVILNVAVSHDGRTIATGSNDKTIRIWDAESGNCLRTLTGHGSWVEGIAFSKDDKTLVSGGHDRTVRFWDVEKGTQIDFIVAPVTIRTVHLTADGKTLLVGGIQKLLLVLDAASHKQQAVLWNGTPTYVPGSPTAVPANVAMDTLPPADPSAGRSRGWRMAALFGGLTILLACAIWATVRRSRGEPSALSSAPSADSKAPVISNGKIHRHHLMTVLVLLACLGLFGSILARYMRPANSPAQFTHDFRSGSLPKDMTPFGPLENDYVKKETDGLRVTLPRERPDYLVPGLSMPVSLTGDFEITAAFEILHADEPAPGAKSYGLGVLLSVNEAARVGRLVRANGQQVVSWDLWDQPNGDRKFLSGAIRGNGMSGRLRLKRTGTILHFLWAPGMVGEQFEEAQSRDFGTDPITQLCLEFCGDAGHTPGALDVRLRGLEMHSGLPTTNDSPASGDRRLHGHTGPVHNIRFLPDGRLVSGSGWPAGDRTLRLWETAGGSDLKRLPLPAQVQALDVSPDGRFALVGMSSGQIVYVNIEAFQPIQILNGHASSVGWVGFAPDGKTAFSTSSDGTARMWNLANGEEMKRFTVVNPRARGGAVFADGKRLLTGDGTGLLQIWDVESGKEIKRCSRTGFIDSLDLMPDGKLVLISGVGGTQLYDLDADKLIRTYLEEAEEVHAIALSPDRKSLLTAAFDGKVRLWDFANGKLIRVLGEHDGYAFSVAFSPDGRWAASAGDGHKRDGTDVPGTDHAIRLWDLSASPPATALEAPRRPWLVAASGILLLLALAFAGFWYASRRVTSDKAVPPTLPESIIIKCPNCGKAFKGKPEWAGKKAKCPCGHALIVPNAAIQDTSHREKSDDPGDKTESKSYRAFVLVGTLIVLAVAASVWRFRTAGAKSHASLVNVMVGHEFNPNVEESGFHYQEQFRGQPLRWTDGNAQLTIPIDKGAPPEAVFVRLALFRGRGVNAGHVQISVNGHTLFNDEIRIGDWAKTIDLRGIDLGDRVVLDIVSDTFVPKGSGQGGANDMRTLGVQVRGVTLLPKFDETLKPLSPADLFDRTLGLEPIQGVGEEGLFFPETGRGMGTFRWTTGPAKLTLPLGDQRPRAMQVVLSLPIPRTLRVAIKVNGHSLIDQRVTIGQLWTRTFDLADIPPEREMMIEILSDIRAPRGPNDDQRSLGVGFRGITLISGTLSFVNVPLGVRDIPEVELMGFLQPESGEKGPFRWTNGAAQLRVPLRGHMPKKLVLTGEVPNRPPFHVQISVDGQKLFDNDVQPNGHWSIELPLAGVKLADPTQIEIVTSTVVPAEGTTENKDNRKLGLRIYRLMLVDDAAAEAKPGADTR